VALVAPFESGRRLCVLVEAGPARFAVEATAVTEVAAVGPDERTVRGLMELQDLSVLLGGGPEVRPGMAVVLDVSPTLALRVARVVEVVDVAPAPFFLLPPGMGGPLGVLARGALVHGERLYLELEPEALLHPPGAARAPARPLALLETPPERALVFASQGRLYGVPLPLVSQVIAGGGAFCPLPVAEGPVAGLFPHGQVLWPICSVGGLLGEQPVREELFVLTELAGQNVGLGAERVLGVHTDFTPGEAPGEFRVPGLVDSPLFLDLQRMFS
jgi:chemotaxis signal transduction protein